MGAFLDKLYHFHQLTYRLHLLRQQVQSQRRRAQIQERKIAEHARQTEQLREQIRKAQADAGEAELNLKTRDATLEKLRGQLNTAKTNKEYSALLREINTFKADTSKLEETALQRMGAVETLKGQLTELTRQAEAEQRRLAELQGQAAGRERELTGQIAQVEGERQAAATDIPADILAQFDRLADAHDGEAMAPVVKPHPKRDEYVCGGCNMGITLEQVSALSSRDEVQTCNCCGRLLYLGEAAGV
jgi:predicted  nucleic acid-binding Zn-ribbon protein